MIAWMRLGIGARFGSRLRQGQRNESRTPNDGGNAKGGHPFVLAQGDRCVIFYHVHYEPADAAYGTRRTAIQMGELELDGGGKITCDRDRYAPR